MQLLRLLFALGFAATTFSAPFAEGGGKTHRPRGPSLSAEGVWAQMNPGWNLGNTLDAIPDETSWGNPAATREVFAEIKAAGFKSVRIPVTWADHFASQAPNYTVNPAWLSRVSTVLDYALSLDLWVVTNVHHDSWQWADFSQTPDPARMEKFKKLWVQFADLVKDKPYKLILESLNEPASGSETQEMADRYNEVNQAFVDIVRASGGKNRDRLLTLPGLKTNIKLTVDWFKEPEGAQPYILHVHDYDPWDFVSTSWGRTFWGTDSDKQQIEDTFVSLSNRFKAPALIGEWGLNGKSVERSYSWIYFDFLVRTARKYNLTTQLWDNGFDHYDRPNKKWRDPVKPAIIVSATKGVPNALPKRDQIATVYIRTSETIAQDRTIELELNGNSLVEIKNARGKALKKGSDYTISGGTVMVKAAYFASAVSAGKLGVQDTLTLRFSQGVSLPFDIAMYTTPTTPEPSVTVTDASRDLRIPVDPKGSKLATIKALKADGSILKDDWTQWLGPLQQGRINWGDFDEAEDRSGIVVYPSLLGTIKNSGQSVDLTLEYWPRTDTANNVTVRVTVP